MVSESWNFHQNNITKELLLNLLKMDMELKFSSMETNTEENIVKVNFMEKEDILGPILLFLKGISIKAWDMDMGHGNQPKLILIFMWDHMRTIKKVDMEDIFGLMDAFMKVIFQKMSSKLFFILGMAREDLFILMGEKLKEYGKKVLYLKQLLRIQNNIYKRML